MRRFHAFPQAPPLAARNTLQASGINDPRVPQTPSFQVMGQGSMLQVQLPPSIDLIAKRNALTGFLSPSGHKQLTSKFIFPRYFFQKLIGRQPLFTQRIVGVEHSTCLLSSNKYLSTLELNGEIDWIVRSKIVAKVGSRLTAKPKLGWPLNSAAPFPHTLLSGRGIISFESDASPVQVNVAEGETVWVNLKHLNAYSRDLNAVYKSPKITNVPNEFEKINTVKLNRWDKFLKTLSDLWSSKFVEITGPATVVVSSRESLIDKMRWTN